MIKRLVAFDFDDTLIDSPEKEQGKVQWSEKMGKPYPYIGWWGRPESLDLNVFDIKPFPSVLNQLKEEQSKPNTYLIVLTLRIEKLRPEVQAVLDVNNIDVDKLDMKRSEKTKGQKILEYINKFPDLREVNVYEDRDTDIESYENVRNKIPKGIKFNIYLATNGKLSLLEAKNKLLNVIQEEIQDFIKN
jgi:FMN phosphatase YigB (HAD superfamily)